MKAKKSQKSLKRELQAVSILLAVAALLFGLYLVDVGISASAAVFSFIAFLVFITPYILLGSPALVKELINRNESNNSITSLIVAAAIFVLFANGYAALTEQFTTLFALFSIMWILLVGAVTYFLSLQKSSSILDIVLIALLWLPLEFGLLNQISIPGVQSIANPFALIGLFVLVYFYVVVRKYDMGYTFQLKVEDYRVIILDFIVLFLVCLILGMLTGFLSIADHMPPFKELFIQFGFIFFLVALPEELLFRGVIFTLLKKLFKSQKRHVAVAMILSSILFGLAHLNNPVGPLTDLTIGAKTFQIPWALIIISTAAGLFYCFVYIRTKKITAAAAIHLLVNWVYFSFFK